MSPDFFCSRSLILKDGSKVILFLVCSLFPSAAFYVGFFLVLFCVIPEATNTMHRISINRSVGKPSNVPISDVYCEVFKRS